MKKSLILTLGLGIFLLGSCGNNDVSTFDPNNWTDKDYLDKAFKGTVASYQNGISFTDETVDRSSQKNFYVCGISDVVGKVNKESVTKTIAFDWIVSDDSLFKVNDISSIPGAKLYTPKYSEIKEDTKVTLKGIAYLNSDTKTVTYNLVIKANA